MIFGTSVGTSIFLLLTSFTIGFLFLLPIVGRAGRYDDVYRLEKIAVICSPGRE